MPTRISRTGPELDAARSYRTCSACKAAKPREEFAKCAMYGRQRKCRDCAREYMRLWNQRTHRREREAERYHEDPSFRDKRRARSRIGMQIQRGSRERQPCERCGAPEGQAHHDDYENPNDVRWLCVKCHGAHHYPNAQGDDRQLPLFDEKEA